MSDRPRHLVMRPGDPPPIYDDLVMRPGDPPGRIVNLIGRPTVSGSEGEWAGVPYPSGTTRQTAKRILSPEMQSGFNGRYSGMDQRFSPEETSALADLLERQEPQYLDTLPRKGTRYVRTEGGHGAENVASDWFDGGSVPTRAQSAQDRQYDAMQIEQADAADARRNESLGMEVAEKARQAKLAEIESAMDFHERYGVPPNSPIATAMISADREEETNLDWRNATAQNKKMLTTGTISPEQHKVQQRQIDRIFGVRMRAPSGYFDEPKSNDLDWLGLPTRGAERSPQG